MTTASPDTSRKSLDSTFSVEIDDDIDLNERCFFGQINIFTALSMLAVINLLIDLVGVALSSKSDLIFLFIVLAIGSLLCLGAVVTSVREEKKRLVSFTQVWVVFKFLITLVSVTILWVEDYMELELTGLSISPIEEMWPLIVLLPLFVLFLCLQFYVAKLVIQLIALRDEIYIIPSPEGSIRMRESLRLALKEMDNRRPQKY